MAPVLNLSKFSKYGMENTLESHSKNGVSSIKIVCQLVYVVWVLTVSYTSKAVWKVTKSNLRQK